MTEVKARQIVLAARPQGKPKLTDFRLEETAVPTPSAGQVLLLVRYLSLDPYMRLMMDDRESYTKPVPLGGVMPGEAVATVIASKHPDYAEGDIVLARTGWRTHALSDGAGLRADLLVQRHRITPHQGGLPPAQTEAEGVDLVAGGRAGRSHW